MQFQFVKSVIFFCFVRQCAFLVHGMLRPNPQQDAMSEASSNKGSGNITPQLEHFDEFNGLKSPSSYIKYLGCYDFWKSRFWDFVKTEFYENLTLAQCVKYCTENTGHTKAEIYLLRGSFCGCLEWETDGLIRLDETSCHLDCTPSDNAEHRSCGGNHAGSLYCDQSTSRWCTRGLKSSRINRTESETGSKSTKPDEYDASVKIQGLEVALTCFNCTNPLHCYANYLTLKFTYIPQNSPSNCVKFCGKGLEYYDGRSGKFMLREPTRYAMVGWSFIDGIEVPTCKCSDELPQHVALPNTYCDKPCPGSPEEQCGGDPPFIYSMYETTWEQFSTTPIISTTIPTGESSSASTTEITTTSVTTVESVSMTHFETSATDSLSTITATTEHTTERGTTAANDIISETPEPEDKITTANPCLPKCEAKGTHREDWIGCAGELANQTCPRQAHGYATWTCSPSGSFLGSPDYSQCSTRWIKEIRDRIGDGEVTPKDAGEIFEFIHLRMKENVGEENKGNYFGHEINEIMGLVSKVFHQLTPNTDVPHFGSLTETAVVIFENLLVIARPWSELSHPNRSFIGTQLIQMIESTVINLTARATVNATDKYRKFFGSEYPEFITISGGGQSKSLTGNDSLRFPFEEETSDGSFIRLPDGWANYVPGLVGNTSGAELNFIGMSISSWIIAHIFPETSVAAKLMIESQASKWMNGKLMSFSISNPMSHKDHMINFPGNGVQIRFWHDRETSTSGVKDLKRRLHAGEIPRVVLGSAVCVFWNTTKLEWSSEGCKLVNSGRSATTCECSHLTSFAVLMDMHNYVGKDFALEILTLILCPISIMCLLATILIFTMIRSTHGVRTTLTKNLCMSLMLGNILVLLILDRHYLNMSDNVCTGFAILVHYVFLTVFMWTGVQGHHLYKEVVHVFESGQSHMTIYRVIVYGIPLLIVGLTVVLAFVEGDHAYLGEMFCWLQGNYIWSFMAPVALICSGNVVVLVIALRAAYHVKSPMNKIQPQVQRSRTWIKGCLSVSVLLGLTWFIGYFMLIDSIGSTIAAYAFTVLNASQGIFLFIFHCVLDEKVQSAAIRKNVLVPSWLTFTGEHPSSSPQLKYCGVNGQTDPKGSRSNVYTPSAFQQRNPEPKPMNTDFLRIPLTVFPVCLGISCLVIQLEILEVSTIMTFGSYVKLQILWTAIIRFLKTSIPKQEVATNGPLFRHVDQTYLHQVRSAPLRNKPATKSTKHKIHCARASTSHPIRVTTHQ